MCFKPAVSAARIKLSASNKSVSSKDPCIKRDEGAIECTKYKPYSHPSSASETLGNEYRSQCFHSVSLLDALCSTTFGLRVRARKRKCLDRCCRRWDPTNPLAPATATKGLPCRVSFKVSYAPSAQLIGAPFPPRSLEKTSAP